LWSGINAGAGTPLASLFIPASNNGRARQGVGSINDYRYTLQLTSIHGRLVVGSVLGEIRAFCDKVTTLDTKYGPFGMIICIGDFFDDREDQTTIDELFNGTIKGV
jgi:hypothetical protein